MKKFLLTFLIFLTFFLFFPPFVQSEERSVTIKPKEKRDLSVEAKKASDTAFTGKYYALIIGNNDYKYIPKLETARKDAVEVEKLLKERYGFETKLLLDAKRKDILSTINEFRKNLSIDDSFLIYYAGHGELDKIADKTYWLPVDAQRDDPTDWIMADDLTTNIKRIGARHVLIVADSCYSGTLSRSFNADLLSKGGREEFLKKMRAKPSRTLMASGGNEPVSDSGGSGHSVFADTFLKALREVDKTTFTAEELFHSFIKERVAGKSEQTPEYNTIKNSGHDGGDFVFQLASLFPLNKGGLGVVESEIKPSAEISEELKNIQQEKERLKKEREELEQKKALMEEKNSLEEERRKLEKEKVAMATVIGDTRDTVTGMELIFVKGGCYQMGDTFGDGENDEKPMHEVCVDDFYMGKYEVTQKQWKAIMGNNPSGFSGCDNCPVEQVSWDDIQGFITTLTVRTGKGYRLPTEAEWEYAARSGGKREKYSGGDNLDSVGWYESNSGSKTHPVGQKQPNGLGLYDMSGNVWEWVQDWYDDDYYRKSPKNNPEGASSGQHRVLRGGSWSNVARNTRTAIRRWSDPVDRYVSLGFRVVGTN